MARKRNIRKSIYLTEEEYADVLSKMKKIRINNFGEFIRKIMEFSNPVFIDTKGLRELSYEVQKVGVNINQIAKVANQTGNIYKNDIDDVNEKLTKITEFVDFIYSEFEKTNGGK